MRSAIDQYLDEVLGHASLAPQDARHVRAELQDHLEELVARQRSFTEEEVLAMLNSEFGKPETVGKGIAAARGRWRSYVRKRKFRLPIGVAIAVLLAFSIRWTVAEEFSAASNAAAPSVPQGSRVLVYKLASALHPGDVIVFRAPDGKTLLGVVKNDTGAAVTVSRNGEADRVIPRAAVVGRVVLNTR